MVLPCLCIPSASPPASLRAVLSHCLTSLNKSFPTIGWFEDCSVGFLLVIYFYGLIVWLL